MGGKQKKLRMIVGSDLHGNLPSLPPSDVLVLVGDLFPWQNHEPGYQRTWQEEVLYPWLHHQEARHKILVAGNHDFLWQEEHPLGKFCYLEDEGIEVGGWKFWGTPWTPPQPGSNRRWAFKLGEDDLGKRFSSIPDDTDVLLSHGPPWGLLDWTGKRHAGSVSLLENIERVRPALLLCGHIHESAGSLISGRTLMINTTVRDRERRAGQMWTVELGPDGIFWERAVRK